jgi:uncharacterized phiE125 gp8 family phage protein
VGYVLVTPPGQEPVSTQEAKLHLKVTSLAEDTLIQALIVAARQYAEHETQRSLMAQTWRLTLDRFPYGGMSMSSWGQEFSIPDNAIRIGKGPVTAITGITYVDMAAATQTLSPSNYVADLSEPLARITPVFGKIWPPTLPQIGAVNVTFAAGYGKAVDVPAGIKAWMLLRIAALYQNREEIGKPLQPLPFVDCLLDPFRIVLA